VDTDNDDRSRELAQWSLRLFDGWQIRRDDHVIDVAWRERRLLSLLALQGERPRTYLAGLLWPDSDESRALGSLRAAVWRIQHTLPGLVTDGHGPLSLGARAHVDVHDMFDVVRRISAGLEAEDPRDALEALRHGDLLPGSYDDWVVYERERLQQLRLRALELLADQLTARGDVDHALEAAMSAVAIEPLRESAHRALIRVHLLVGNHVDAVRVYRTFRHRLRAEMGITPSPQIIDLIRPLLAVRAAGDVVGRPVALQPAGRRDRRQARGNAPYLE
jgi:DNA-binding SARP family transcriptional activator